MKSLLDINTSSLLIWTRHFAPSHLYQLKQRGARGASFSDEDEDVSGVVLRVTARKGFSEHVRSKPGYLEEVTSEGSFLQSVLCHLCQTCHVLPLPALTT